MKAGMSILLTIACLFSLQAQYNFETIKDLACTEVKNQQKTGTCWSFATSSFIESELLRQGKGSHDLSEMYIVKNIYREKAHNYVLRQGKANFSQGSLSHDFMHAMAKYGVVPESVYSGRSSADEVYDHGEMEAVLEGMLERIVKQKRPSENWDDAIDAVLDVYLGKAAENFKADGKQFTPREYGQSLKIDDRDYISVTSFSHHPFYTNFILEIPDNFSNGSYFNVPVDDLKSIVDHAIGQGYSIAWDGDVSEKGFSASKGIAVLPTEADREDLFDNPGREEAVTQASRQEAFNSYDTTDDHLMHIVGTAKDKSGNKYYKVKNSWGPVGPEGGFLYMSEAYFKAKTIAILLHKEALPASVGAKLIEG